MKMVQFIAGATCPSCGAKDTIAINAENTLIYCVQCNFTEKRPKEIKSKDQAINVINIQDYKKPKS
ncbi:YheV family putative metal-binding protein [Gammaproteobacteria bacterium]|nr:YheV family putative metal-binding protein [Gammaproteobacteria bacterium]